MPRVGFYAQVKKDRLVEYKERHKDVWAEMREALTETGWRNYSLFLRDDGLLFGYVEVDDLKAAVAAMEEKEVNARWQAQMGQYFEELGDRRPDEGFLQMEEIFHLD